MNDPLEKATAALPPTLGEGCLSRFDPAALSPQHGTDFPDAAELWRRTYPDNAPEPAD